MDAASLRAFCLDQPGSWPDHPFGEDMLTVKVHDKIFAFVDEESLGVKAALTREVADEWLLRYPRAARPMPYLGRSGWNQLDLGGEIPDDELRDAVEESYRLVVSRLAAKHRPPGWERPSGR